MHLPEWANLVATEQHQDIVTGKQLNTVTAMISGANIATLEFLS